MGITSVNCKTKIIDLMVMFILFQGLGFNKLLKSCPKCPVRNNDFYQIQE